MKTRLFILFLGLTLLAAPAVTGAIINISNNPHKDEWPKINNNGDILWQGYSGDSYEIYLSNGSNKTQITDNSYVDSHASLNSAGQAAWLGQVNFTWEIFFYDGSSTIRVTDNNYQEGPPQINDNGTIAWSGMDSVNGDWEIFVYDISGITQLTHNSVKDSSPCINSRGHIVWLQDNCSILYYDGTTVRKITDKNYTSLEYRINDNDLIAWSGRTENNYDEICLYDGTGIFQIATNPVSLGCPKINSSSQIAWAAFDGNDWEIFIYDGYTVTRLTDNNYDDDYSLEIAGNGNVVWQGHDGNDWEIFLYDNAKGILQLTDNSYDDLRPQINANNHITWYGYNGDNWEVFAANMNSSRTIHVPEDYSTITEAVAAATYGDTIKLAAGKFRGAILKPGLKITGAGADKTFVWWLFNAASDCTIENLAMIDGYVQIREGAENVAVRRLLLDGAGYGILARGSNSFLAENNTIVNQGYIDEHGFPQGAGIYYGENSNVVIRNNIIANNPGYGIVTWWKDSTDVCEYNDLYNNSRDYKVAQPGEGSIAVDPLFKDAEGGDYQLTANSLCIDAGDPDKRYNDPDGSRNDMGVFPYEAPEVTLAITAVPAKVLKNHKYTVKWKVAGDFEEVEQTEVLWGLASGEYTHAGNSFSGAAGEFQDSLRAPKMKDKKEPFYLFLAAHALVAGTDFYSAEKKVMVIHDLGKKKEKEQIKEEEEQQDLSVPDIEEEDEDDDAEEEENNCEPIKLWAYRTTLITLPEPSQQQEQQKEEINPSSTVSSKGAVIQTVSPPAKTVLKTIANTPVDLDYFKSIVISILQRNSLEFRVKWLLADNSDWDSEDLVEKLVSEGYAEEEIRQVLAECCNANHK